MRLKITYLVAGGGAAPFVGGLEDPKEGFVVDFFTFWVDLSFSRSSSGNC